MPEDSHPREPRLRRITLRLVLFLLLGATLNVAVAWVCSWLLDSGEQTFTRQFCTAERHCWNVNLVEQFGAARAFINTSMQSVADVEPARWGSPLLETRIEFDSPQSVEQAAGWPSFSVWCRCDTEGMTERFPPDFAVAYATWRTRPALGGLAISTYKADGMPTLFGINLPFMPIWPGFAVNTAAYAMVSWLLVALPLVLRRWRRIRRGLCANCAYPVGTSDVCTECGTAVHRR